MGAGDRDAGADDPQGAEQRRLAVRNASAIALESVSMRYAVVIDDVIVGDTAELYRDALQGLATNVHFVTLLPDLETTLARDAARSGSIPDRVRALHEQFERERAAGLLPGAVIDSTRDANAEATADRALDAVARGEALFIEATG